MFLPRLKALTDAVGDICQDRSVSCTGFGVRALSDARESPLVLVDGLRVGASASRLTISSCTTLKHIDVSAKPIII